MPAGDNSESQGLSGKDRVIRVFISSTFRDMMRERDLLVKEVFPELRRKCAKRFVTFTEVDLRWGITEAQANEGQVLPLCLAEIERSRPYFIGLLGERYGWIPDTIRPEVIAREPWLKEHVQGRTSVTELEILHGVLNNPKMQSHAFFYFRDSAYVNSIPEQDRKDYTAENAKDAGKLRNLKDTIRRSGFPVREGYRNPKVLSRVIRRDLSRLIDRLYPEDQVPDPLAQERMAHEAHAKNKLFACIDRPAHLAALNAFAAPAEHAGKGLVVTGESGGGKTALLAAWARDWSKNHPEDFLFQHYFGATPDSASPEGFLRRLLGELKSCFSITDEIPTDPEKLRDALPVWLAQTSAKALTRPTGHPLSSDGRGAGGEGQSRIVLVLDGLNQVQGSEPDRHLLFLPRHLPPHVVALASALPGPALDALRERGWTEHDLPRASEAEVDAMVGEYLKIHARALEPEVRHELVTAPGAKNPLFLRTVLEELRQFGSFERLPQRVRHYLEAGNPKDLFLRVLTRWQEDFDGKDKEQDKPKLNLVRRALTHLWAARQGLSEPEWLDLLGWDPQSATSDSALRTPHSEITTPLPRAMWTPLFLALEPHLSQRAGLFAFGHDFLRQAVKAEFVPSGDLRQASHLALADYFELHRHQQEMTPRKAAEWPHQLHAAQAWDRLEACLTNIPLFLAFYNANTQWELTGYWLPLRQQGRDMEACYAGAYERDASRDSHLAYSLGAFLINNGCFHTGKALTENAAAASRTSFGSLGEFDANFATSQGNLASVLEAQGDFANAAAIRERVLSVYKLSFGKQDRFTATACINLAGTYLSMGHWRDAELLIKRAIALDERIYGGEHPEVANDLVSLAESLRGGGKPDEAEAVLRRALFICRNGLSSNHPLRATVVSNLAALLIQTERPKEAEVLALEAVDIDRESWGNEHPKLAIHLNNLAAAMKANGRLRDALAPAQEALKILVTHSVRTGVPHYYTKAAAVTLASLATEAGLPEPFALHIVNNILRPMRGMFKQGAQSEGLGSTAHLSPEIPEDPAQTANAARNAPATDAQNSVGSESKTNQDRHAKPSQHESHPVSEARTRDGNGGIDPVSQILVQLDPRNVRYQAERGDPQAQCRLAVLFESEGDVENAAVWYRRAAQQSIAQAQFNLGVLLQNGSGVEQNLAEAVTWYEEAARQGYLNAIFNLAFMRENGYGCAKDLSAALHLYESAAREREPDSQCKLALLLLDENTQARAGFPYRREGWGFVPVNHERARTLLQDAATNGHIVSRDVLRNLGWN